MLCLTTGDSVVLLSRRSSKKSLLSASVGSWTTTTSPDDSQNNSRTYQQRPLQLQYDMSRWEEFLLYNNENINYYQLLFYCILVQLFTIIILHHVPKKLALTLFIISVPNCDWFGQPLRSSLSTMSLSVCQSVTYVRWLNSMSNRQTIWSSK